MNFSNIVKGDLYMLKPDEGLAQDILGGAIRQGIPYIKRSSRWRNDKLIFLIESDIDGGQIQCSIQAESDWDLGIFKASLRDDLNRKVISKTKVLNLNDSNTRFVGKEFGKELIKLSYREEGF
jgi:hypothetical protein